MSGSASVPGKSVKRVNVAFSSGLVQPLCGDAARPEADRQPRHDRTAKATNVNTRQREGWSRSCVAGASCGAGLLDRLVDFDARVADIAQPALRILLEASPQQPSIDRGVAGGQAVQSGSRSRIAAIVSDTVSPANASAPVSIS